MPKAAKESKASRAAARNMSAPMKLAAKQKEINEFKATIVNKTAEIEALQKTVDLRKWQAEAREFVHVKFNFHVDLDRNTATTAGPHTYLKGIEAVAIVSNKCKEPDRFGNFVSTKAPFSNTSPTKWEENHDHRINFRFLNGFPHPEGKMRIKVVMFEQKPGGGRGYLRTLMTVDDASPPAFEDGASRTYVKYFTLTKQERDMNPFKDGVYVFQVEASMSV
jgi:hypothetical protein